MEVVLRMDMTRGHPLTGPFYVNGCGPGDLLEVEILDVADHLFGFTCVRPAAGALRRFNPEPFVARWELDGHVAISKDVRGVTIKAAPSVGVVGVAPSPKNLVGYRAREDALAARGGDVFPPFGKTAVPAWEPVASEGLPTVPPRENGATSTRSTSAPAGRS